ncbi:MAG TPA: DUF4291 domain-containing protein [Tepidisphaeraceae bacterium]|jgi:hypothetical protein|nr:DUF4291 domain-containing protein [Tepidisphaeraceae bacterium]
MKLRTEPYHLQKARWPTDGRHILAQFDNERVVIYQAFRPEISCFAVARGYFGDGFSMNRMSWIKPNFLWMMYRCGWAAKPGQETVLAVTLHRLAFDEILSTAVHSSFQPGIYESKDQWERSVCGSEVRLQWDPDHEPCGRPTVRRAIQLGLRGSTLARYAREWICDIEDVSDFVLEQKARFDAGGSSALLTPREEIYPVADESTRRALGIDA